MTIPPEICQLATMLDDPDNRVALNLLAQLLAREEDLGTLPEQLRQAPDPLVRQRAKMLQHALIMRQHRRKVSQIWQDGNEPDIFAILTILHLLWFDSDSQSDIQQDIESFTGHAAKFSLQSLEDAELFMRSLCVLPEKETVIRPELYCIGSVLDQQCGATSLLLTVIRELLGREKFQLVNIMGEFGLMDSNCRVLLGNGSWHLADCPGVEPEAWSSCQMLKYLTLTLLSCAVNSDSYRYVMSLTQALTGDESRDIYASFPYPFGKEERFRKNLQH